ncbi:MAG: DNA-3-methyladenine glycosylase I [Marmoricola sp.]
MTDLFLAPDGDLRCTWAGGSPGELAYHDAEWGFPVHEDRRLFEKVSLEGFQSGLSWRTILDKRENFRAAFAGFDFHLVADYTEADVERLLQDAGIVRHRGKIEAVINNAARALELVDVEGSLSAYFWGFRPASDAEGQAAAVAMAKDLKRRGWRFVGPTTAFAFIQAMGLINDHQPGCVIRERIPRL